MKYELDTWYGWDGGECPVHPEDKVDVLLRSEVTGNHEVSIADAEDWVWDHDGSSEDILAFRITEFHKEPEPKGLVWRKGEDGTEYCDTPAGRVVITDRGDLGAWMVQPDCLGLAFSGVHEAKSHVQKKVNRKAREYAKLSTDEQPEDDAGDAREFWAYRDGDGHWRVKRAKPIGRWDEVIRVREVK